MPRLNSFHLPPERWPAPGADVTLDGPEARHMLGVLRQLPGDTVRLFDGQGREGLFTIARATKREAQLGMLSQDSVPLPRHGLTLALGWNKSSRRDWLLEKAVEFGALGLWFWRAKRSQGEPPAAPKDSWQEKAIQSAKQCGALWLPEMRTFDGMEGLLRVAQGFDGCYLLWEAAEAQALVSGQTLASGRNLLVLGPEGGLDEPEARRLLDAGFEAASLGPRPLRWETAALHCLSLAYHAALAHPNP